MTTADTESCAEVSLDRLVERLPVFFYLWELDSQRLLFTSPFCSEVTGYAASELESFGGNVWDTLIHAEDVRRLKRSHEQLRSCGDNQVSETQFRLRHRTKGWRYFQGYERAYCENQEGMPKCVLGVAFDLTEHKNQEKRLQASQNRLKSLSLTDPLTKLPNRVFLSDRLASAIKSAKRASNQVAVLFFDVDNFKYINDTYGHKIGDQVLITFAQRILKVIREEDTLARLGGDEFVLVCQSLEQVQDIRIILHKILAEFHQIVNVEDLTFWLTCSIGISVYPDDGKTPEALIKTADIAMYHAKKNGKNDYQFFSKKMTEAMLQRLQIERELVAAIEEKQFCVHYQPLINIHTGKTIGLEALLRWKHPEKGMIYPDDFVRVAEELRLIVPIGEFVFQQACHDFQAFKDHADFGGYLALNVSGVQIERSDFVSMAMDSVSVYDFAPSDIELEITESVIMDDAKSWVAVLTDLKEKGFKVAIDDFGKGYSSLTHLSQLPVDKIKIDRSFVEDITHTQAAKSITEIVVYLAQKMKMTAFAEGVEHEPQKEILEAIGCEFVQGFYYSEPKPFDEMMDVLKAAS